MPLGTRTVRSSSELSELSEGRPGCLGAVRLVWVVFGLFGHVRTLPPLSGWCLADVGPVCGLSGCSVDVRVVSGGTEFILKLFTRERSIDGCDHRSARRSPARRVFVRLLTQPFSCGGCDPPMPAFRLRFFSFFLFCFFEVGPIVLFGGDTNLLTYPIPCRRADGFRDRAAGFLARFGCSGETPTP